MSKSIYKSNIPSKSTLYISMGYILNRSYPELYRPFLHTDSLKPHQKSISRLFVYSRIDNLCPDRIMFRFLYLLVIFYYFHDLLSHIDDCVKVQSHEFHVRQ